MKTAELFEQNGRTFLYIDFSGAKSNLEFGLVIERAKDLIATCPEQSVYTITNGADVGFDTQTKEMVAEWMRFAKPYVIFGAIIGVDGIKKIMISSLLKMTGRSNFKILGTKEEAVQWICAHID